jgi:TolB-like protein/Tfp pilus assembly protein PilF
MSLFEELKRRNVFRVGAAYVVVGWLIIQVVETIFPIYGIAESWIRLVITVLAIGLIPLLIFAWAFELTPEGLKKESDVDRTQSIAPHTGKKLDRTIMVVLALALVYFAVDKFVLNPQREAAVQKQVAVQVEEAIQQGRTEALVESYGDKSIAVLAFQDMSQDKDQEYLSDGIAEELLNLLAKIPDLRVISRSSAFSFKGQNLELTEIAERLNVAHILEGSVRKAGNKVRITAQLIEARSDTHLWSETYDRELDDIFAIQDEISATVVAQLKITLLGEAPKTVEINSEAYALFLQARHLGQQFTVDTIEQSNALHEQVLEIAPDYAPVYVELGKNYLNQSSIGVLPVPDAISRARKAFQRALEIDPLDGHAHAMLGWIAMIYENELAEAAKHFEKALALDPGDLTIVSNSAVLAATLARVDETVALMEFIAERDPVDPASHSNLALAYLFTHQPAKSIESSRTALRLGPGRVWVHETISLAYLLKGEPEAALQAIEQEEDELSKDHTRAMVFFSLGREGEFRRALESFIEEWSENAPGRLASIYAWSAQIDQAFDWLERAAASNDPFIGV